MDKLLLIKVFTDSEGTFNIKTVGIFNIKDKHFLTINSHGQVLLPWPLYFQGVEAGSIMM